MRAMKASAPPSAARAQLPSERALAPRCGPAPGFGGSKRSKWRALALVAVHLAAIAHIAHWKLGGSTVTPLEPSEAGQTFELGYVNAGFLVLALSTLATLVVGRFFCGWACHVVAYQDLCAALLAKLGLRPKPIRTRLLAWIPLLAALEMFAWPLAQRLWSGGGWPAARARFTTTELWERFPGPWISLLTVAVCGGLLVWLFGAKGFCSYGCPYGGVFGLVERFARGRIRVTEACEGCGHCSAVCTSNVLVHAEVARFGQVVDAGCMKCLDCVSACPKDALYFGFGPSRAAALAAKPAAAARSYDFGWGEELALAALFAGALWTFRGLYGAVPFLLAIGLALVVALAALVLWRLVRQPDFRLQHVQLRRAGLPTRAGWIAALAGSALLAFTLHSAVWHSYEREGVGYLEQAAQHPRGDAQRARYLGASLLHLSYARSIGLFDSAALENQIGQIVLEQGDRAGAESHLRRALELEPEWESARVLLADLLALTGRFDEAREELVLALEAHPDSRPAIERMAKALFAAADREAQLARLAPAARAAVEAEIARLEAAGLQR